MFWVLAKVSDSKDNWREQLEWRGGGGGQTGIGRSPSVATLQEEETQVNHVEDGNQCKAGRKEEDRKVLL
jgi:hypothetical protein